MKLTEARDRIAVLLGWQRQQGDKAGPLGWRHERWDHYLWMIDHPIPYTLDAIAALWEKHCKGWRIEINVSATYCRALCENGELRLFQSSTTMIEAWTRLLLAVLEVQHETKV